ncbi:MAG: hypothetical protein QOK23_1481 [Gammaproteobacteria bacterium]|nr:hypothetical protein [Gammaproteobacteria bacterium]
MFDKISRSWSLAGQCWDVLKEDPKLLVFPLMSSIALLVLLGSFALPVLALYHSVQPVMTDDSTTHTSRLLFYITTYLFYLVSYTVMMFFNSALISVALKRLDGESASVGEGLQMAFANLPAILGYAIIAATVGTILRAIEERVGLIGRIVVAIIGAGWTVATAMTLPVLIEENVGPIEAISRSLALLRRNWGENLIGNGGISLGIAVVAIPLVLLAGLLLFAAIATKASGTIILALLFFVLTIVILGLVSSTLHTIYTAALYRFATGSKENAGINGELLADAYRQK